MSNNAAANRFGRYSLLVLKDRISIRDHDNKGYPCYDIDFERAKTKFEILDWVHHMAQKNWVPHIMALKIGEILKDQAGVEITQEEMEKALRFYPAIAPKDAL